MPLPLDLVEMGLPAEMQAAVDAHGRREQLRPTGPHKFYSDTRHDWVAAKDIHDNEVIRGRPGPLTITAKRQLLGTQRVYNLTVEGEHVYYVSHLGLLAHNNGCKEEFIRIRHYTNRPGLNGIKEEGVIRASDKNSVFAERARGKPLSRADAEDKYGIARGKGRDYVEINVPASRVQVVKNADTKSYEIKIEGDVPLIDPTFVKRR